MVFTLPEYNLPDFSTRSFTEAPDIKVEPVLRDSVAPDNYYGTSIYPTYLKVDGEWNLLTDSRMDCVVVVDNGLEAKEFRRLKKDEQVVVGRAEDASQGIYIHTTGFDYESCHSDEFAFRTGRTRETSFTSDYDVLYELLHHERDNGYIVWVLGPAVVFNKDTRDSMHDIIQNSYADALLAGNALATHDLEAALMGTALGNSIDNSMPVAHGHYNHIDVNNMAREAGSIKDLIEQKGIDNGVMYACVSNNVPFVLAGSIRDDGPLPDVITDTTVAQDKMREHLRKATTVVCLATQLHTIASGNMTPSYTAVDGKVRPVYTYIVDTSEFAARKLMDRGTLTVTPIFTNVQDFLYILRNGLLRK